MCVVIKMLRALSVKQESSCGVTSRMQDLFNLISDDTLRSSSVLCARFAAAADVTKHPYARVGARNEANSRY